MSLVLVVEDDADILRIITITLEREGLEVEGVTDVMSGWARMHERDFDLVLVDWMLPVVGGIELVRNARADPAFRKLPIVMVTARTQRKEIKEGLDAGATAYITKPFSPRVLAEEVASLLAASGPRT